MEEDSEKAEVLLQTFFPKQPNLQLQVQEGEQITEPTKDWSDKDIQESEVHYAIFSSNPRKALGLNDLLFWV